MRFDEEDGTVTNWGVLKATCRVFRVKKNATATAITEDEDN